MGLNLIQTGRFNRLFQKLFSMKGGAAVTEVGAEILPVMPIRIGREARYLEGWNIFAIQTQSAAGGAATRNLIKIRNPLGSGLIAVFEKILFESVLTDEPFLNQERPSTSANDLLAFPTTNITSLDARSTSKSTAMVITNNNAAPSAVPGQGIWVGRYPAAGSIEAITTTDQEIPLLPGDALYLACGTVNQADNFTAQWRERAMEESEFK